MTDRELLEAAAKAAGIELKWHPDEAVAYSDVRDSGYWSVWNPLTDDGDALRLAVKLKLTPMMRNLGVDVVSLETTEAAYERYRDDPYAATRRAIVRAAAEIGRSKT